MRLALALGRTVAELEATMTADEWADWLVFHGRYDLPDGFLVTGQLGALISGALGAKLKPADLAPYYQADLDEQGRRQPDLKPAIAFVQAVMRERKGQS